MVTRNADSTSVKPPTKPKLEQARILRIWYMPQTTGKSPHIPQAGIEVSSVCQGETNPAVGRKEDARP